MKILGSRWSLYFFGGIKRTLTNIKKKKKCGLEGVWKNTPDSTGDLKGLEKIFLKILGS